MILEIKIAGKTYTTGRLPAYIARETNRMAVQSIELAKKHAELIEMKQSGVTGAADLALLSDIAEKAIELMNRKSWVICEAYGNQFTVNELEKELTPLEIDTEVNRIASAVKGILEKN